MINYLCTSPIPRLKGTDAMYNEIELLRNTFGGQVESIFPFKKQLPKIPVFLYGMNNIRKINSLQNKSKANHIFGTGLYNMPLLKNLKLDTYYSVIAGLGDKPKIPNLSYLKNYKSIIVSNQRDLKTLKDKGLKNIECIIGGIDTTKISRNTLHSKGKLKLLMASSPWDRSQFESKGIVSLLKAVKTISNIHITFLWRNVLPDYMKKLIEEHNVKDKVKFINAYRNVDQILKKVHGVVLLTNNSNIVKAYPHSLIESIVSGKPVITTSEIPMSDFINENNAGIVLQDLLPKSIVSGFQEFKEKYVSLKSSVESISPDYFSSQKLISEYSRIYSQCL